MSDTKNQTAAGAERWAEMAVRAGMKCLYVKRWRTIILVPESIADEIRAALATPVACASREALLNSVIEKQSLALMKILTGAANPIQIARQAMDECAALTPDAGDRG